VTGPDFRTAVIVGRDSRLTASSAKESVSTSAPLIVGQRVRVAEWVRPRTFARKDGVVLTFSEGEVGVRLGKLSNHQPTVWFRPSELEVGESASRAPRRPAKRGGAQSLTPEFSGRCQP